MIKNKYICLILVLAFAFVLIFYQFPLTPNGLTFDEIEFAKLALSLDKAGYTAYSPLATGHSTLYFYIILLLLKIFGVTTFVLRLSAAIFGVINAGLIFLIFSHIKIRDNTNNFIAFLASVIFVSLHWYLNFARFSFEATFLLMLELSSLLFLIKYLATKDIKLLIFSVIFAGFAFHSYTPGRIFFVLPLMTIMLFGYSSRQIIPGWIRNLLIYILTIIIISLPLSYYLLTHGDSRVDKQNIFSNSKLSTKTRLYFIGQNIYKTTSMFVYKGDINGRHNYPGKPALNPIFGLLFIVGLAVAVKNYRDIYHQIFLGYFAISLLPSLITYPWENPNMLRTVTAIPSVVYFIVVAFAHLRGVFDSPSGWYKKISFLSPRGWVIIILFIIYLAIIYELRTYFFYQQLVFVDAFNYQGELILFVK